MKPSFRAVLLTVLLAFVLTTVLSLGVSGYLTSHATAQDLTLKVLDQASLVIDREMRGLLIKTDQYGDITQRMVRAGTLGLDHPTELVGYFRAVMEDFPELTGIFLGTEASGECLGLSQ
jgi:hypothetical protein